MKRFLLALLVLVSASRAVDTLSIPTNYLTVTTGTRATLAGNFTAIETWGNKVRDSIAQVTARLGGYTGNLAVTSLSNLRLKLDGDNSETARLLVESGNGDSLFTVREDSTAKFYGGVTLNDLTASLPVVTNSSKKLTSATVTGTGTTVVMSTSPTIATPAFTGITNPVGPVHIGGTSSTARAFRIAGIALSGDNQYGALISPTFTSASTTQGVTGYFGFTTEAAAFTMATGIGLRVDAPSIGAASAVTNLYGLKVENQSGGTNNWAIKTGTGKVELGDSLVGISQRLTGSITADTLISSKFYEENTFTGTLTGVSGTVTGTFRYVRVGKSVTLSAPYLIGTSNTTACTITGMPAAIRPARKIAFMTTLMDNGSGSNGALTGFEIETSGTLTLYLGGNASGFTGSGSKGLVGSVNGSPAATEYTAFSYTLQ